MTEKNNNSNNPIRKIPIIHRIFAFAAGDIPTTSNLSLVCYDWREAFEVYGKPILANFYEQDPKDYARFIFELCEWGEGTWLCELMIDAWQDRIIGAPKSSSDSSVAEKIDFTKENVEASLKFANLVVKKRPKSAKARTHEEDMNSDVGSDADEKNNDDEGSDNTNNKPERRKSPKSITLLFFYQNK